MTNKSKKIIGLLAVIISVLGGYSLSSAQSAYIVTNPNNQYFYANSAYGRNYYANNWGYNYNYNSPCRGLKNCYSLNYVSYSYDYPTYNNYNNNYNYNYNNNNYNNNYPNTYYSNSYQYRPYNNYANY